MRSGLSLYRATLPWLLFTLAWVPPSTGFGQSEEAEFFEKRIRPVLVDKCYPCHSDATQKPGGDLRLDTRDGTRTGGSRGATILPGKPQESVLIRALSYKDAQLQMPPTGKLTDQQLADFTEWIRMGAPDPRGGESTASAAKGFDFDKASQFWFFQGLSDTQIGQVRDNAMKEWPTSPIDFFMLDKLEQAGLYPAPPADKRTWIRRVSFDLIGLPPKTEEIEAFLADQSPAAYRKVTDRLLASSHYGERWGRYWLDLVGFAETGGHEYDYDKLFAWRYRDYIIRAFNDDVPYIQLIREHIAGDLIAEKRISADGSHWESPLGTSFLWLGESYNPLDYEKFRADVVDNQIDILGKTFLGLTISCARCHDHKFDPIPTTDYYGLAGILHSTTLREQIIDAPARARRIRSLHQRIADQNDTIRHALRPARRRLVEDLPRHLLAAAGQLGRNTNEESTAPHPDGERESRPDSLRAWVMELEQARRAPEHVLYPFVAIHDKLAEHGLASSTDATRFNELITGFSAELQQRADMSRRTNAHQEDRGEVVFEDFEKLSFDGWARTGQAFGPGPHHEVPPNQTLRNYQGQGLANSFRGGSDKLVGSLTSEEVVVPKRYLHVRMGGTEQPDLKLKAKLRLTVVSNGSKNIHLYPEGGGQLRWNRYGMKRLLGRPIHLEILDRSRDGHIIVDKIVFSDSREPPSVEAPNRLVQNMLGRSDMTGLESLAERYRDLFSSALEQERSVRDQQTRWLLASLNPTGKMEDLGSLLQEHEKKELIELQALRSRLDSEIPPSAFALVARDEAPHNVRVHIRGNHQNLGEEVPRRYLQILGGTNQLPVLAGSGRLQLAEWLVQPQPQAARVMVNRIWQHHFGQGIIRSVDNFGHTGERPTHPELLDFLAERFIESGWSIKQMHRLIVLSSTYRMSSKVSKEAGRKDPLNKLLHHVPVRRLEGEAVRDSILAVAGNLDRQIFGPGVTPYISEYQEGRGRPESGPLDGNGRRSIYIEVRRNFITPMFLAFDYPLPTSTRGRRNVSTVPSQALILMNNEFVTTQSESWARRLMVEENDAQERLARMYASAFGRPPKGWESEAALDFVRTQTAQYLELNQPDGSSRADQQAWADLAHVLFNSPEFIYIR